MTSKSLSTALRTASYLRPLGKEAFLRQLPSSPTILDVGCGNESPLRTKVLRPDSRYIGVDVTDYNQTSQEHMDEYALCKPSEFNATLARYRGTADAVISSHNIEHCDYPEETLELMVDALRPGGHLFIAWPCEASVDFPSRQGTLNFHDDPTHQHDVPPYRMVRDSLAGSLDVVRESRRSRPPVPFAIGAFLEPVSAVSKRVMPLRSTWALYGFESIIWARKPA